MDDKSIVTMVEVRQFLEGTGDVELVIEAKEERYRWIEETFKRFDYPRQGRADKGLLLDLIEKVSGYSRIQLKRFAKQLPDTEAVKWHRSQKPRGFTRRFTNDDIRLLAKTDDLHKTL